jgi:hypothetical protein
MTAKHTGNKYTFKIDGTDGSGASFNSPYVDIYNESGTRIAGYYRATNVTTSYTGYYYVKVSGGTGSYVMAYRCEP